MTDFAELAASHDPQAEFAIPKEEWPGNVRMHLFVVTDELRPEGFDFITEQAIDPASGELVFDAWGTDTYNPYSGRYADYDMGSAAKFNPSQAKRQNPNWRQQHQDRLQRRFGTTYLQQQAGLIEASGALVFDPVYRGDFSTQERQVTKRIVGKLGKLFDVTEDIGGSFESMKARLDAVTDGLAADVVELELLTTIGLLAKVREYSEYVNEEDGTPADMNLGVVLHIYQLGVSKYLEAAGFRQFKLDIGDADGLEPFDEVVISKRYNQEVSDEQWTRLVFYLASFHTIDGLRQQYGYGAVSTTREVLSNLGQILSQQDKVNIVDNYLAALGELAVPQKAKKRPAIANRQLLDVRIAMKLEIEDRSGQTIEELLQATVEDN